MEKGLFRKEALEHRRHGSFGGVIIQKPLSFTVLSTLTAALVLVILAFLIWGQYTRKQTVHGYLVPDNGLIEVYAPNDGVISEKHVQDGAPVKKGQVLFVVSTKQSTTGTPDVGKSLLEDSSHARSVLQDQINKTRQLGVVQQQQIKARISSLKSDLSHTQAQLETEKSRLAIAQSEYDKMQSLKTRGYITDTQYQAQHDHVLQEQSSIEALQKQIDDTNQSIADSTLNLSISALQNVNQLADYQKDLSQLDQQDTELQAKHDFIVQAPMDGVASSVLYEPGQAVNPNMPLMAILPSGSVLQAKLFVPTSAIGFIKTGQQVLLRYEAFPYQHFGLYQGTIKEISRSIVKPDQLPVPIPLEGPVYPVTVALDTQSVQAYGQGVPLQAGMLLDADVILNHQRLMSWILEPIYGVKGRL